FGPVPLPEAWKARLCAERPRRPEDEGLCRRILLEMHREIELRGLRHFFLLLHGDASLQNLPGQDWQAPLVLDVCRKNRIPVISSRPFLLAAGGGGVDRALRLFGGSPRERGHYNRAGNAAVFEAIREGMLGHFAAPDTSRVTAMQAAGLLEPPVERSRTIRILDVDGHFVWRGDRTCICWGSLDCPSG